MLDVVVIGGGAVGLATAYKLLLKDPRASIAVVEKETSLAAHQTGRNSGVIHSGIYYKPGSLKARNCRAGVEQLVRFCEDHGVTYEMCGKVIVATSEEERERLRSLFQRGQENGVPGLRLIGAGELKDIEPEASGVEAIHSPRTGIVSFRGVAEKCAELVRQRGGEIRTSASVVGLYERDGCVVVETTAGELEAKYVIACAGLHSDRIASLTGANHSLLVVPFRGEYYRLRRESRHLVRHLIYPVPDPRFPFLGVHFTRRVDGEIEAGPNAVLAWAREGYRRSSVNIGDLWQMATFGGFWRMASRHWKQALSEYRRSFSRRAFVSTLQKLVPSVTVGDLEAGGCGVRAMALAKDGELVDDFRIVRTGNVIHVLNAPSPAATACLSIADHIIGLLD